MKKFKIILASLTLVLCFNFAFAKKKDNNFENVNKVDIYNLDEDDLIRIILRNQNIVAMPFQTREQMIQWLLQNNQLPLQLQNQNQNLNQEQEQNLNQNQEQNNLLYKFTNEQKNFLIENCGFDYETLGYLENIIRHLFVDLGADRYVLEDTIKKTVGNIEEEITFALIFTLDENSPQGFECEYNEI